MGDIKQYDPEVAAKNRIKGEAMANAVIGIFQTLRAYYPKCNIVMKTEKHELDMMREWGIALAKSGVNQEMLKSGISSAKAYAAEDKFCNWPALGDFISWCHGMPLSELAYIEASKNCHNIADWEPTHPAVALVFKSLSINHFKTLTNSQAKSEYVRAYGKVCARVLSGEKLTYSKPEKMDRLAYKQTPEKKEQGSRSLSALKQMLGSQEKEQPKEMSQEELAERKLKIKNDIEKLMAKKGGDNE